MKRTFCIWGRIVGTVFLFLCFLSCSKSGSGAENDGNTPYVILDLQATSVTDSTVTLSWTATGDDADVGTASVYDLRYYHTWITHTNWDSATQVIGEPAPHAAGLTDTMRVTGLKKDSTYYFALNVSDEAGNWSGPSNCVQVVCFTNIIVTFADHNLEAIIRTAISKPSGDIHRSDLMGLTYLDANSGGIASLTGMEFCTNLITILMADNSIADLSPIATLISLRDLQFFNNDISSISAISGLVNLERVSLGSNSISNLSALSGWTQIHLLDLSHNEITDIAPLVANAGLAAGDSISLIANPLSQESIDNHIPTLETRGVTVLR